MPFLPPDLGNQDVSHYSLGEYPGIYKSRFITCGEGRSDILQQTMWSIHNQVERSIASEGGIFKNLI
jgi:hypothetical protein